MSFLWDVLDKCKAFFTSTAIAACHVGFNGKMSKLVRHFIKGTHRIVPFPRPMVPLWDLAEALDGLSGPTFELLEEIDLKYMSLKNGLSWQYLNIYSCTEVENVL